MTSHSSSIGVNSDSPTETLAVAQRLSALLRPGDVISLVGKLGAGKTLFACGVAEGLGVQEPVTSPTFVIAKRYEGFLPVYHADVYRVGSTGEFDDLDLPAQSVDGVLMVEWGNAVAGLLPIDHLVVELEMTSETGREIRFTPEGAWCGRSLDGLVA